MFRQMLSYTEENYLKIIMLLSSPTNEGVGTNLIAKKLEVNAASVSDMLKKLQHKRLIDYTKYQGVNLTEEGRKIAIQIIRKHRLWETFLVDKLNFSWDEVHEVAEQLEHIQSPLLTERLYEFLNYPKFDPHGDAIPNSYGVFPNTETLICLKSCKVQQKIIIRNVTDDNASLLQFLSKNKIVLGATVTINDLIVYNNSIEVCVTDCKTVVLSEDIASKIYGVCIN